MLRGRKRSQDDWDQESDVTGRLSWRHGVGLRVCWDKEARYNGSDTEIGIAAEDCGEKARRVGRRRGEEMEGGRERERRVSPPVSSVLTGLARFLLFSVYVHIQHLPLQQPSSSSSSAQPPTANTRVLCSRNTSHTSTDRVQLAPTPGFTRLTLRRARAMRRVEQRGRLWRRVPQPPPAQNTHSLQTPAMFTVSATCTSI
ncbi:hypothetical protein PYCCODRAFT_463135 [Trametes coccinea BRFM310]|uniref:Uncharacterized protein n=1 Tax=Trametes coccinea (strain BRFM310) TaxID=1353009 RepID=A0A1Y2ILG4_TRAC3|nr:hypothetical protein PYCCODRAFT_463135 [Trametes coccinea BRFM310]